MCDNNALFLSELGRKQQSISVQNLFDLAINLTVLVIGVLRLSDFKI